MIGSRQRMWDYMRKDKLFSPNTMFVVQGFSYQSIRNFLVPLMIAGVVKDMSPKMKLIKKKLLLCELKEPLVPKVSHQRVLMMKSQMFCDVGAKKLLLRAIKNSSQGIVSKETGIDKSIVNQLVHNKYTSPREKHYKKIREVYG